MPLYLPFLHGVMHLLVVEPYPGHQDLSHYLPDLLHDVYVKIRGERDNEPAAPAHVPVQVPEHPAYLGRVEVLYDVKARYHVELPLKVEVSQVPRVHVLGAHLVYGELHALGPYVHACNVAPLGVFKEVDEHPGAAPRVQHRALIRYHREYLVYLGLVEEMRRGQGVEVRPVVVVRRLVYPLIALSHGSSFHGASDILKSYEPDAVPLYYGPGLLVQQELQVLLPVVYRLALKLNA